MELHTLKSSGLKGRKTRVGRGGKRGKTAGRGTKGQKARAGNKRRPEWRDIIKKLPKRRGYGKNRGKTVVPRMAAQAISLDKLSKQFKEGDTVSVKSLLKARLLRRTSGRIPQVKIVSGGDVRKLTFEGVSVTASAKTAIEKAGGTIK
jgi:large subunit ribosomal protein L15